MQNIIPVRINSVNENRMVLFSFKCLSLLFRSILSVLSSKKFNLFFFYNFDYEEQNPIVRSECEENSATSVNTIPQPCIQPARGVLLLRISIRQ